MNESHSDSQEQNPGNYHVTATQPHNTQPAQQQHQRAADRSLRPTFPTNTKKSAPPFALSRPNTTTSYKQGLNPPTGLTGPKTGKTPKTPHHTTPTGHTTTRTPDMQPPPHPGGQTPRSQPSHAPLLRLISPLVLFRWGYWWVVLLRHLSQ